MSVSSTASVALRGFAQRSSISIASRYRSHCALQKRAFVNQNTSIAQDGLPSAPLTSRRSPFFTSPSPKNTKEKDLESPSSQKSAKAQRKDARRHKESTSLRRVAVEAQRSRNSGFIKGRGKARFVDRDVETKDVTAYCAAETYNLHVARDVLRKEGHAIDPFQTNLFPQALHIRTASDTFHKPDDGGNETGDIFVFPSGCLVTWNVSERIGRGFLDRLVPSAGENSHLDKLEAEDFEYVEDPTREHSAVIGDTVVLGTKQPAELQLQQNQASDNPHEQGSSQMTSKEPEKDHRTDLSLTRIAFSSALARSAKLAVLENTLEYYFTTTRSIPSTLSRGTKPRFNRAFILRKTGELLYLRAQLNLYSELTDNLPDIFWDSPHELRLENSYDSLSRMLDVDLRIEALNRKMDYASEIATVLRERMGEKHGHSLEWIIIWLIVIEVVFGMKHVWSEWLEERDPQSERNLAKEFYLRQLEKDRQ